MIIFVVVMGFGIATKVWVNYIVLDHNGLHMLLFALPMWATNTLNTFTGCWKFQYQISVARAVFYTNHCFSPYPHPPMTLKHTGNIFRDRSVECPSHPLLFQVFFSLSSLLSIQLCLNFILHHSYVGQYLLKVTLIAANEF